MLSLTISWILWLMPVAVKSWLAAVVDTKVAPALLPIVRSNLVPDWLIRWGIQAMLKYVHSMFWLMAGPGSLGPRMSMRGAAQRAELGSPLCWWAGSCTAMLPKAPRCLQGSTCAM